MVDGAYSVGIDYDVYRNRDFYEPIHFVSEAPSKLSLPYLFLLMCVASVLMFSFILYTLTCIPYFDIETVSVVSLNNNSIPPSIIEALEQEVIGSSYYSPIRVKIKSLISKKLEVKDVIIKKIRKDHSVIISLDLDPIDAVLVVDNSFLGISGSSVFPLHEEDAQFYVKDTIKITSTIIGEKQELESLMSVLTQQNLDPTGFGYEMSQGEIYFPSLRLTLRIRESISYSRLHYVLQLIRLEREKSQITNITLHSQVCYDVYQNTLRMDCGR